MIEIDVDVFLDKVWNDERLHVILFYGAGCFSCDRVKPVFDIFAKTNREVARFSTIAAHEHPSLAGYFKVMVVPTLVRIERDKTIPADCDKTSRKFITRKLLGPKTEEDIRQLVLHG